MGACCIKPKQENPDEDSGVLLNKKDYPSPPTSPLTTQQSMQSSMDISKFIDYDQYTTLKLLENCFTILSLNKDQLLSLSHKSQSILSLEPEQKLIQYGHLRCEETDLQKKLIASIHDNYKALQLIYLNKHSDLEHRLEQIEKAFKNSKWMNKQRTSVFEEFKELKDPKKEDFCGLVEKIGKCEKICEAVREIERVLFKGKDVAERVREVERKISMLSKTSLAATHHFEMVFGDSVDVGNIDVMAMKSVELEISNFFSFFDSLEMYLGNLQELENLKNKVLENNSIKDKLRGIDKTLTKHFMNSEQSKEVACSRLNRVSRSQSEYSQQSFLQFLQFEVSEMSIPETISILKEKAKKYLKSLENQDKVLLEMTEKFNTIDRIVDDIELKFQDYISSEVKELHKFVGNSEDWVKSSLEALTEKVIQYEESTHHDLVERLETFQTKFNLTDSLGEIKSALKDSHFKELAKVKNELQDKVNKLNNTIDQVSNEKNLIESNFATVKSQLEKTSKISEELLKEQREKEVTIMTLKGNINSHEETLNQINQEKNQLEDEVEELRKELRECKKNLRNKEHELSEIRENISSNE